MSGERMDLALGEERSVHLDPGEWIASVGGMSSAVDVRKLWAADPYPEDDEDDEATSERPPQDVVFMIRGRSPGSATVRFTPSGNAAAEAKTLEVTVRS
jgi:head-tail adaptor